MHILIQWETRCSHIFSTMKCEFMFNTCRVGSGNNDLGVCPPLTESSFRNTHSIFIIFCEEKRKKALFGCERKQSLELLQCHYTFKKELGRHLHLVAAMLEVSAEYFVVRVREPQRNTKVRHCQSFGLSGCGC
ncbi:hypothetical protein VNO77_29115 [Canavalia gladiata]|uniref:Uncharacterized protein n=1 Tax=Canavalia gladiata TaxID=3824 RepID=A0AAN9KWS3_CANGL